ncbi:MAG TPA: peptidoglycan editing factor PgeF [Streptosporangiaceae bacterium]|nr:peptidoglycan editing factor PgeF [Streptosporangiaceae bacterium]
MSGTGGPVGLGTAAALSRPAELCPGVRVLFTGRPGGVSGGSFGTLNLSGRVGDDPAAVADNRGRVLRAIGPRPRRLAWMRQVHGAGVAYVAAVPVGGAPGQEGEDADGQPEADAAFTDSPEVAVGVLAADCAPVLVADPAAGLVGAAHAGRPGMAAGVVPALVAAMAEAGADPARMHAIIGPSICGRCYEVPAAMRDEVAAAAPGSACETRKGTPGLDLRAGLRGQLAALGVSRLSDDLRCTAETAELFSYRRDGQTGRFAGLIWLAP